jgi:DNA-binding transcriptional LysR family regulator
VDIENLKTFLEVHKTRHFGHAADNLFITSAAVSARIKQLEQYLGVALFLRNRGNVQLTSAGERLLPHAQTLVSTWARTLQEISLQNSQTSRLHIGSTAGLWQFALPKKISIIAGALPEVSLQAEAHTNEELVRRLFERSLDLVVLYEPPNLPELKIEKIGQLKLTLASNTNNQLVKQAFQAGYIYVDWGESFAIFHANRFGEVAPASLTVNLASIAVARLATNPGSAYLPRSFIDGNSFLYPVKGVPIFNRTIYAAYREGHNNPELLTEVVELLKGLAI